MVPVVPALDSRSGVDVSILVLGAESQSRERRDAELVSPMREPQWLQKFLTAASTAARVARIRWAIGNADGVSRV